MMEALVCHPLGKLSHVTHLHTETSKTTTTTTTTTHMMSLL